MPGIAMSAPYWARPVTFGTPSGRIGRVPTHLNRVGAMSFIALSVVAFSGLTAAYRHAARTQKQNRQPETPLESLSKHAHRHLGDNIDRYHWCDMGEPCYALSPRSGRQQIVKATLL
jgi:hypothetical protein